MEIKALLSARVGEVICADCQTLCDSIVIRGCRLDRCPICHGVWLDAGEAQRVKHLFPDNSTVVDADKNRAKAKKNQSGFAVGPLVEIVAELLILLP